MARPTKARAARAVEKFRRAVRAPLFSNLTLLVPTSGICMFCGCTDSAACEGGCSWINDEQNWCSACADSLMAVLAGWLLGRAGKEVR
jgi:hypothetical protein